MKITMLGCGGSVGVPNLGGGWGACDPEEPRNRRRRCSVLVQKADKTILVDASPDLREQLLDTGVRSIDALLLTHMHADHTHGMDDLRPLYWTTRERIPTYADAETFADVRARFGYMFEHSPTSPPHFTPPLDHRPIDEGTEEIAGVSVEAMRQDHGTSGESLGFVFDGRFAYSTDVAHFADAQLDRLASLNLDLWLVDCLREQPTTAHGNLETTLGWVERVKPKQAYFIHMNAQLDYRATLAKCPPGVAPGHDGLVVDLGPA